MAEALVMVSEVVTNAVRHGGPPVRLKVRCASLTGAVCARHGRGDPRPPAPTQAGPEEESGRGVALVDALSDAWGVEPGDPGNTVWFTLSAVE